MKAAIFSVLAIPITLTASSGQLLVVSDRAYYLDGVEAQELSEFNFDANTNSPIIIEACVGADISRLTAAMDWLTEQGRKRLAVRSVQEKDQKLCRESP